MKLKKSLRHQIIPSEELARIYLLLKSSNHHMSVVEIAAQSKTSRVTSMHRLTDFFKAGLVKRRKSVNNEFRYWWDPQPDAKMLAADIEAAAEDLQRDLPTPLADDTATVAGELEKLAALFASAARAIRSRG